MSADDITQTEHYTKQTLVHWNNYGLYLKDKLNSLGLKYSAILRLSYLICLTVSWLNVLFFKISNAAYSYSTLQAGSRQYLTLPFVNFIKGVF